MTSSSAKLLVFTAALLIAGTALGLALQYPGQSPGPSTISTNENLIVISNRSIHATWRVGPKGPRTPTFIDIQGRSTIALQGELFEIRLSDGESYSLSNLIPDGAMRLTELAVTPAASRLAERARRRMLEVPLCSPDRRIGITWRAVASDEANYIRQELELSALTTDCEIQSITWLSELLPGAHTVGQVDGSVVAIQNFFLGCEDPHALNQAGPLLRTIGEWSPDDLEIGARRRKTWSVDNSLMRAGTNRVVFRYQGGPHRLDIWHVALLENGREVARDKHHGRAGTEHVDNTYDLVLPELKRNARVELVAEIGTDPDYKFPEAERANSSGKVEAITSPDSRVVCQLQRNAVLKRGENVKVSFVVGVAPANQLRRAFLYYLERERAHSYRPYLHYNSWYDIAWTPFALNETNCLEAIRLFGERFIKAHGVVLDGMVFDDGWDDPKSLWQFHAGFPNGFAPLAQLCLEYNTRLGVWLSPFGGYGEPRRQRLQFGSAQGYETNATGFSLAGPKYYAAFKNACARMIRDFGVNHFKFDGIATGMYASGGGQYLLDTEAMRRLMLELRQEDPGLYINLTTGSWPSPFWLRYADSVWRQGGDMGHAGKGSKQQQWLTYRDQETFRNIVRKGPLYPLNSLMSQGVAYSRQGMAGDPTFDAEGFRDDVRAFFGSGTGLQELYIQPGRLSTEDWRLLAEAAKWSHANADVLVDTHWFGGDPGKLEVYGYASWTARKGLLMLRNPDAQSHDAVFDVERVFELPPGAEKQYRFKSPWAEDASQPERHASSGESVRLNLKPFQVVILEATPVRDSKTSGP